MTTRFDDATVAKLKSKTYTYKLETSLHGVARFMCYYDLNDGFDKNPRAIADPREQWVEAGTSITMYGGRSYATVGYITGYVWDWKDNTANGSGVQITHTYQTVGDYYGILKVTDSGGRVGMDIFIVHVVMAGKRVVYAAEEGGRGYVTLDDGVTWRTLILDSLPILSTAADPVNMNRGYWGGYYGYVFATRDAGLTCAYSVSLGSPVKALAIDPVNTAIVWAGCQNGRLWRSSDYARHFAEKKNFGFPITSIIIDPINSNRVAVCGGETQSELHLTVDGGQSWTDLGSLIPAPLGTSAKMVQFSTMTIGPIYLAIFGGTGGTGIKRGNINELSVAFINSSGLSSDNILDVSGIPGSDLQAYVIVENSGMIWRTLNGQAFSQRADVGVHVYSIRSDIKGCSWIGASNGVYKGFGGGLTFVQKKSTAAKINQVALGPLLEGEPPELYLAPGQYSEWGKGHLGQGTIYKLVGGVWQLLSTFGRDEEADPENFSDGGYVSCTFWDATLEKLYAIPWYREWVDVEFAPNPEPYDIYEVDTVTGEVTALGHSSVMRPVDEFPGYWNNPLCYCQQAAKFGNYWFITGVRQEEYVAWPGSYYERAVLFKFDPIANTMVLIDAEPVDHETSTYTPGVATDGTTLYWWFIDDDAANYIVYRRTVDGINFVTDEEHADRTRWPYAEMKYNPANGRFQVAAYGHTFPPLVQFGKLLYRNPAESWVVDQAPGIAGDPYFVGSVGFRYVGNVCTYEYILAYAEAMAFWPPANRQRVYSRAANSTGVFIEENVAGLQGGSPVNNAFASLSGRIYCFKGSQVFYRDGDTGVWTEETDFGLWENGGHTLWSGGPLVHGFCIATSIPISEI